jgi:CBS domain-containing protein
VEKEEKAVRVKDLMTRNVISISVKKSVMEAASVMTEAGISAVLLKSGNEFTGVITDHDIISKVVALGLDPREVMAGEVMSSPLITISEEASVEEAAEKMRDNNIRRLIVKNKLRVAGIISESDLVRVAPELHFLIREHCRLEVRRPSVVENGELGFAGFCEECGNYSEDLKNVNGRWFCEECIT